MTMCIGPPTLSRSQVVDQSFPIIADNLAIMIPYPELGNDLQLTVTSSLTIVFIFHKCKILIFLTKKSITIRIDYIIDSSDSYLSGLTALVCLLL